MIPTEPVRVDAYGKTPCQCQISTDPRDRFDAIRYCPTHAHAFAMRTLLEDAVKMDDGYDTGDQAARALRLLAARAREVLRGAQ